VQVEDFQWLQGEHLIKYYESEGGYLRGFCRECGSPIINRTGPNWKRAAQFPRALSQYGIPGGAIQYSLLLPRCHRCRCICDRFGGERLTYTPEKPRPPASKLKRIYAPRIISDHIMLQEDFGRLHKFLLEMEDISEVSDDIREPVEEEWPELMHKLPPKVP
jgi:hypothetical protein